ncbi:hypothetical protein AVEN_17916-1 [Araneus ventricosus]|uniref:Uncharacterized protein n=1 Tax=Araneus ventricosus TaxID=182803 RepID=A0A4Y2G186_ARAVE|nr:hypothetical protein AVEN_17916-1 [Araneus ventricosus]
MRYADITFLCNRMCKTRCINSWPFKQKCSSPRKYASLWITGLNELQRHRNKSRKTSLSSAKAGDYAEKGFLYPSQRQVTMPRKDFFIHRKDRGLCRERISLSIATMRRNDFIIQ